jgi:NAD(P)H-nitrite reductase large subunit
MKLICSIFYIKGDIIKVSILDVLEGNMEQDINSEIMDKLTKVCVCRGISRASVKKAISDGAKTVEDVKRITGAGSGSCKGSRCSERIQCLLDQSGDG